MGAAVDGVIRRRLGRAQALLAEGGPGADRAFRLAIARGARDLLKLMLDVDSLVLDRHSLTELLDMLPERALIGILEGPQEGLGLICIAPDVLAGLIEARTIGRVTSQPAMVRKPTRTDAAMVAELIDATLHGAEGMLQEDNDLIWLGGFRYASFIDDPRPLGLLLEDAPYRVLRASVSLSDGLKRGEVLLALPAEGKGPRPALRPVVVEVDDPGPIFTAGLAEQVQASECTLDAVLMRLTIPLSAVMGLKVGDLVPLPMAALDRIGFEGLDGRKLAEGKLGQNRGMRAVRLMPSAAGQLSAQAALALRPTGTG